MFISKIHGKEETTAKAEALGLKAGESVGRGYGTPALAGNTFACKDALKAAGARWISADKVWGFESWDALEAALNSLAA